MIMKSLHHLTGKLAINHLEFDGAFMFIVANIQIVSSNVSAALTNYYYFPLKYQ